MDLSSHDRDILRALVEEKAAVATLPIHQEKAEMWRRLNDLERVRPMVWVNEICWHEMNVNDELTLGCQDAWARTVETALRRELYQWRHLPCDMIVSPHVACPKVIHTTGFGLSENVDIARTDEASNVVSRHFYRQIIEPEDVEKIQFPTVTYDEPSTMERLQALEAAVGDILPIHLEGKKNIWFAPWDFLIRLWGVQEAMMDLALRPQMVNAVMTRLVDAHLHELDQWEALNVLERNDDNTRIGSGAYGYTAALPGDDYDPARVTPANMWGCATAQIFSEVSPAMHWEFALKHEMRYLERWGMTYYGCCEPLDIKMGILRRIPNLRKVSMSPWIDIERGAAELGRDYVFSRKPTPAILAEDTWRPALARQQLREALEKAQGCNVEVIMKDISTVRYHPERLWEWAEMAMEEVERVAP